MLPLLVGRYATQEGIKKIGPYVILYVLLFWSIIAIILVNVFTKDAKKKKDANIGLGAGIGLIILAVLGKMGMFSFLRSNKPIYPMMQPMQQPMMQQPMQQPMMQQMQQMQQPMQQPMMQSMMQRYPLNGLGNIFQRGMGSQGFGNMIPRGMFR